MSAAISEEEQAKLEMLGELIRQEAEINEEEEDQTSESDSEDVPEDKKKKALEDFRSWVKSQPHFVNCRTDDSFLLRFLRVRQFNVKAAGDVLDKYLTMKTKYPHCYQQLDIDQGNVKDLISKGYIFPLLEPDNEGRTVLLGIAGALDGSKHKQSDVFRSYVMTLEALLEDEEVQKRGVTYVFDQEGYQVSHAFLVGVRELQRMIRCGEKGMPLRHKRIHWINLPKFLWAIYEILKSFVSPKLQKRVKVHNSLDSFHEFVPQRLMPKEYGGEVTLEEMTSRWIAILESKKESLLKLDKMGVNEDKRPKSS